MARGRWRGRTRSVSWAVERAPPLSASHSTGCGVVRVPKRRSTASSMRSRTAIPPMPRGLAVQARTSRVVGVDGEGEPYRGAMPARDLEHVRRPALVGGGRGDLPVMRSLPAASGMRCQQQARPLQHAVDPLVIGTGQTGCLGLTVQERGDCGDSRSSAGRRPGALCAGAARRRRPCDIEVAGRLPDHM